VLPGKALLENFFKLADASDEMVLQFAQRWGLLNLCQHGFPFDHAGPHLRCPVLWCSTGEPVSAWKDRAKEFLALARIANRLLNSQCGHEKDWAAVYARKTDADAVTGWTGSRIPPRRIDIQRELVAQIANEWLMAGNVGTAVLWRSRDKRPSIRMGGNGLFGALALQLSLALGDFNMTAVCTHCGKQYPIKRRPKSGQRNFCPECRAKRVPTLYSAQDCRERKRSRDAETKTR
jgi:DNA-directed RNA polymerase subunit RPC12/RpoP